MCTLQRIQEERFQVFFLCVYTVTDIHTSKSVVTSLKSSLPTCPTFLFWKQDTEELVCLPQTVSPTSLSFQLLFFSTALVLFFDDNSLCLHRVSIFFYWLCEANIFFFFFFYCRRQSAQLFDLFKNGRIFFIGNASPQPLAPRNRGL